MPLFTKTPKILEMTLLILMFQLTCFNLKVSSVPWCHLTSNARILLRYSQRWQSISKKGLVLKNTKLCSSRIQVIWNKWIDAWPKNGLLLLLLHPWATSRCKRKKVLTLNSMSSSDVFGLISFTKSVTTTTPSLHSTSTRELINSNLLSFTSQNVRQMLMLPQKHDRTEVIYLCK